MRRLTLAVALGLVAGSCAGYLVQAGRTPDKLPPLSQPSLAQAQGHGPAPLSAAQDHQVKVDGDLRKLLLKRPGGTRANPAIESDDGWLDLSAYAELYTKPDGAFRDLVGDEFRRAAVTGWIESGDRTVEIRLIQFRQVESQAAEEEAFGGRGWAADDAHTRSWPVPGTGDGEFFVHDRPESRFGSGYVAEAHAYRGDIAMEMWVGDTKPVSPARVRELARAQMERL
ncbi:hypothetical protein [Streptomyces bauhiniae]|uniref:hypothetical protein n=1 Tax=Streptomyces bauhiniae TaxID=2340725 RepID=UPI001FCABDA8|nr:hypothetical protein [Streptomyces bauhiniae]